MKIDQNTIIILIGIFVILFIAGIVAYSAWSEKKRREALQQFAQENSLVYVREDKAYSEQLTKQPKYELFRQGHSRKAFNFLRGQRYEMKVNLFDYRYTTGSGNHQRILQQTVALIDLERPELVQFTLKTRGIFQKVAEALGRKGIEFENRPVFSQRYVLKGNDEAAIRRTFNDSVLSFFEQQGNLSCEAIEDQLLVYRHNRRVHLDALREFQNNAVQIVDLMRRPTLIGDAYDFGIPKN